jgi:hypothetical protein
MNLIEKAMQREVALLKEISTKDKLISFLRNESGIAREAIERYCPPELLHSADKWLKTKGDRKNV